MKKLITLILCLTSSLMFAQKEANMWYFGYNAALDFNSGPPIVLTNSAMNQFEGCSSIADAQGNLLFYTDGSTVWNRNHVPMPNGFAMGGNTSATQAGLIVPQPGVPYIYYVFSNDAQLGAAGFSYAVIDMQLQGGFGDVTIKNQTLFTPSTEKATACTHANGQDVWIITHDWNNNNFMAYTLSSTGVNTATPVISSVGPIAQGSNANTIGYLKASPQANKLAMAISADNQFWLFDFNPFTGVVSNPIQLTSNLSAGNGAYGVEFSPNGNVLYGSVEGGGGVTMDLFQWDLSSGIAATINASKINLAPTPMGAFYSGSLALAPDKKIYYTRNTCDWLGVINDPDVVGFGCNFADSGVYLLGNQCVYGLPNLNQSYYSNVFQFDKVCYGDSTHFDLNNTSGVLGVAWNFGDPTSGINNFANILNPVHLFSAPGVYNVEVIKYFLLYNDTITLPVEVYSQPSVNLGTDTNLCQGNTLILNAGGGFSTYLWQDGSTDSTYTITLDGTYYVVVSNGGVCSATDSITVTQSPCQPIISMAASDSSFCEKHCVDFFDLSTNSPISWQWFFPGADSTSSNVQNPSGICYNTYGSFDVTLIACNLLGCDTLVLTNFINEYPNPVDTITFNGSNFTSLPFSSYQWYELTIGILNGEINQTYTPTAPGSYFCVATDSIGCVATSNIIVIAGIKDQINSSDIFNVFPNPSNGTLSIQLNNVYFNNGILKVTDATGRLVYEKNIADEKALQKNMDLDVADGIYTMQLTAGNTSYYCKFAVRK